MSDWHTERYCTTLDKLTRKKAIRAIHQAVIQLRTLRELAKGEGYDNEPAISDLEHCLQDAGHPGFAHAVQNLSAEALKTRLYAKHGKEAP